MSLYHSYISIKNLHKKLLVVDIYDDLCLFISCRNFLHENYQLFSKIIIFINRLLYQSNNINLMIIYSSIYYFM